MKKLIALLLLLLATPVFATDWYVYFNDVTNVFKYGQNRGTNITTMTLGFGDVWTKSNNLYAVGTTQIFDQVVSSNYTRWGNAVYEAAHAGQNYKGLQIFVETNGHAYIIGPYSGLMESYTFLGRWSNTPGETYDIFG